MKKFKYSYFVLSAISVLFLMAMSPAPKYQWIPTTINGTSAVYFSINGTLGTGGQIKANPGTTVWVQTSVTGTTGTYYLQMNISGATFSDGTTTMTAANNTITKTFIMPGSGFVNWSGSIHGMSPGDGTGSVSAW